MSDVWEKYLEEIIAAVSVAVMGALAALLKKLNINLFGRKSNGSLAKARVIDEVLDDLVERTEAMTAHVVKFYREKNKNEKNYWRGTIIWESKGNPCSGCMIRCRNYNHILSLKPYWQDQRLSRGYYENVFLKAKNKMRDVHTINITDMPVEDQALWDHIALENLHITGIKKKGSEVYLTDTLYCQRIKPNDQKAGILRHVASKLINHI